MVAALDAARAELTLGRAEMRVAIALLGERDAPLSEEEDLIRVRLEEAGIAAGDRLVGFAERVLAIAAAPQLVIELETHLSLEVRREYVWATPDTAIVASAGPGDVITLRPVDPGLVPLELTRLTGFGPRDGRGERSLRVAAEALGRAAAAVPGGLAAVRAELDGGDDADTLAAVLVARRSSWRARASLQRADGVAAERGVAVLDGGEQGYWLTHHEGEEIVLEPVAPSVVWSRIMDLLPAPAA